MKLPYILLYKRCYFKNIVLLPEVDLDFLGCTEKLVTSCLFCDGYTFQKNLITHTCKYIYSIYYSRCLCKIQSASKCNDISNTSNINMLLCIK